MDDYQLEQFERINEDMRNEGIPDDVLEQSRLLNSLSTARDLARWRYEFADSLPEGKTWDAVLDLWENSVDMNILGIQGLRFLDDKVYVKMYDGKVIEPSGMSLNELVKIKEAIDVERHLHEVRMQNLAYKDSIIRVFEHAYPLASRTKEVITGEFAKDFSGETKWSRALDFDVPGMPYFKGIRYKNFVACTNIYALFMDGESKPLVLLSKSELGSINNGFKTYLQVLKKRKTAKKTYNRYIVSASKTRKAGKNRK